MASVGEDVTGANMGQNQVSGCPSPSPSSSSKTSSSSNSSDRELKGETASESEWSACTAIQQQEEGEESVQEQIPPVAASSKRPISADVDNLAESPGSCALSASASSNGDAREEEVAAAEEDNELVKPASSPTDEFVEIELSGRCELEVKKISGGGGDSGTTTTTTDTMYAHHPHHPHTNHHHQHQHLDQKRYLEVSQQQQQQQQARQQELYRNFGEQPAKLAFASRRMKEYFESFRGHAHESRRLYQFFKSIRTELVACFLFTLITTQTLIVCRTQMAPAQNQPLARPNQPSWWAEVVQPAANVDYRAMGADRKWPLGVHLAQALISSFTVASLTQVFGHISGCHLLPSVSLALYVKGHISRGRLATYLAAQTVGPAMGVSLLSVLSSSQITPQEYRQALMEEEERSQQPPPLKTGARGGPQVVASVVASAVGAGSPGANVFGSDGARRRRRRDLAPSRAEEAAEEELATTTATEGSETILLSIMEQQQELLGSKLKRRQLAAPSELEAPGQEKTITAHASGTYLEAAAASTWPSWAPSAAADSNSNDRSRALAESARLAPSPQRLRQQQQPPPSLPVAAHQADELAGGSKRRTKRNRQQQQQWPSPSSETNSSSQDSNLIEPTSAPTVATPASGYYINLLEFGLPEQIMSGESIRQCIAAERRRQSNAAKLGELATLAFHHCLSLSNSSQMFVFQFLATLLVVLAYLVNVDPRRVDVGFKSLSIGLAYFVAACLTTQAGGFYGQPFQLIFLSWLAPTGEWQPEWFIYLATPFIGGLFGALSHEYIDFTSLRNRNKQLHLRRSFYSLENLPADGVGSTVIAQETLDPVRLIHPTVGQQQQASEPHHLVIPTVAARRSRQLSNSSSSLESAASSIISLNTNNNNRQLTTTFERQGGRHQEATDGRPKTPKKPIMTTTNTSSSTTYSKQLKLEHQQQQQLQLQKARQVLGRGGAGDGTQVKGNPRMSLRSSDFDSNFLISSASSPTTNPRNRHHLGAHNHQQHQQQQHFHHQPPPPHHRQLAAATSTSGWM